VIRNIPKEKYENIFKGGYNRNAAYVKIKQEKIPKIKSAF